MKTAFPRGVAALAAAAVAALTASVFTVAEASTATLDAQQLTFGGSQSAIVMAQTFTAGTSAQLVRVSIPFYTGFGRATVGIQGVSSGKPNGSYLTSQVWSGAQPCCRQFLDLDLTSPVAVTQGTQYAIVVHRLAGSFNWYYSSFAPSGFTGGKLYLSTCDTGSCTWYSGGTFGADFGFKTWVASGVNQPPAVGADTASLSVTEGSAPANTGTYSDPDGDAVTLTASAGTLTKTGTSSGTWSWSGPVPDEASSPATVTVTAADGQGLSSTATFTVAVTGVAPTAQILADPISGPEGSPVPFTGGATSPDPADTAAGFTYTWTVTKDGSPFAQAPGSAFSFTPDDEGTYVVTFAATDDGGLTGTTSMTVIGTNVAPGASITGVSGSVPLVTTTQETLTFGGAFTDPGTLDTHTATWNFGDGSVSTTSLGAGGSASLSAGHAYATAGTYTVTLTVSDDDGGVGRATTTVTVQSTQQALASIAAYVQGLSSLNPGQRNSLVAKLNAASAAASRGDATASGNELSAFLNEVDALQRSGRLSSGQAATLRAAVHAVQGALGTYNRFLEWWPLGA